MGRRRGRFLWRIGCLLVGLILFVSMVATLGVWLAASALCLVGGGVTSRVVAISVLVMSAVGIAAGTRRLRGLATPMGDLVGAAHRIEGAITPYGSPSAAPLRCVPWSAPSTQ